MCHAGIVKEPDKPGKSYAVFAVTVKKKVPYAEEEEIWDVYRRYSDFHDLNMILIEKVCRPKSLSFSLWLFCIKYHIIVFGARKLLEFLPFSDLLPVVTQAIRKF